MELNVTYHWTYLDYLGISSTKAKQGDFNPVAAAEIEAMANLPIAKGLKEQSWHYDRILIPITGTMEPKKEIIQTIQRYADEHNITIEMDYINGKINCGWDEPF